MTFPKTANQAEFIAIARQLGETFATRADQVDRDNTFPFENFRDLHRAGYLALTAPVEYGGSGANLLDYVLTQELIAHGCGSTGLASSMHLSLLGRYAENRLWPTQVYGRVCRDVVEHGALINAVNSEPDLGSPSRGALPSTTGHRTTNGWVINGRKKWASLAPALGYFFSLAAVHDGEHPPYRGNFLIPANTPGVRVIETWDNLGMRGTGSHDVEFVDVQIPAYALLPGDVPSAPWQSAGWYMLPGAAVYLGIAQAACDHAAAYALNRKPSGMDTPISNLPTIQHLLGRIQLQLHQARTLLHATTEWWVEAPEERQEGGWRTAAAKYTASIAALEVTDLALRVTGSAGLAMSSPVQRCFRDARTAIGHPPMEDTVLTILGKRALGLDEAPFAASAARPVNAAPAA